MMGMKIKNNLYKMDVKLHARVETDIPNETLSIENTVE
jgi:hypothetical protein